jgi:hypothetical protein
MMTMMFADLKAKDMRLAMLRCMAEDAGYAINESILQSALEMFGHHASRDNVRTEMRWLEEQGLITIETVAGILVAKLTGRGVDMAEGRCKIDGVKTPRPK